MKLSSITLALSSTLLSIASFVAHSNSTYSTPTELYYTDPSASHLCKELASSITVSLSRMTTLGSTSGCFLSTSTGTYKLFSATSGTIGHSCISPIFCHL